MPVFMPCSTSDRTCCSWLVTLCSELSTVVSQPRASLALAWYWLSCLSWERSCRAVTVPVGESDGLVICRPEVICCCRLASREESACSPASAPREAEPTVTLIIYRPTRPVWLIRVSRTSSTVVSTREDAW